MDYRLLATARAHEIKEKAEWEVELDRVSIHQRMLWLRDFCLPFLLLMGVLQGFSMLAFPLSPTFAIAGDIDSIRYLFGAAAAVYVWVVMLQINVKDTLQRANRELWIIMAQLWLYLEPYIAPCLAVIFGTMALIVGLVVFLGPLMWDILNYFSAIISGGTKFLWTATKDIAKYLWANDEKCEIPTPENNGDPTVNAPTESTPQTNARPEPESNGQPAEIPITEPEPQESPESAQNGQSEPVRRQRRRPGTMREGPLRKYMVRKADPQLGEEGSAPRSPFLLSPLLSPVEQIVEALDVDERPPPWVESKAPNPADNDGQSQPTTPDHREPPAPVAPTFASNQTAPSTSGPRSSPHPKPTPFTPATVRVPTTNKFPAALWNKLEHRLFEYEAAVEEVEEIRRKWPSISDDLVPSKTEDYFAKVKALRSKIVADEKLRYDVKQQWGVVPRLDKVYQSLTDSLSFWESLKSSETFRATKMPNSAGTDDNPVASKKARLMEWQDQAASDQKQFNAKKTASLAKAPTEHWIAQSRKSHLLQGEYLKPAKARSRDVSDYRWAIGENAAKSWTHEKLHMKDAAMVDSLPSSTKGEVDILQSRLEELYRETMTWHGAYFGVPTESWTLEALKKYVDENQYVPDLVLDKVSKNARLDRAILEGGLLSVDVLKHLEELQPAVDELLEQAQLLDFPMSSASSPGLTTFPGSKLSKEEKLVSQTRSLKTVFEATRVQARGGYQNEHQGLRDSTNKALRDRHTMFYETSDVFLLPDLLNLQQTVIKLRETIQRMDSVSITDDNYADARVDLYGELGEFLKYLEAVINASRLMRPYQAQRQVNGNREAVHTFGVAVIKGLQPAPTSGENLLCGPRALIMSLISIGALDRGSQAEDILLQMYEDFYGRRNTSLPDGVKSKLLPAYRDCVEARLGHLSASDYGLYAHTMREAENMNNFSIGQLDLMLAFLVHLGLVEDKYQIGVVSEDCEGGPWTVQIYDHGPSDNRLRETVWLYMDNAEVITEDKNEWRHYARRFQNSKYWPQEADWVLARIGKAEEPSRLAHWSGFSMPTFVNSKRQGPWGLIENAPGNVIAANGENKSLKDAMTSTMRYWKKLEAEAERRVKANAERERQKREPKVEQVDRDGEEALRDFFVPEDAESETESLIELPPSRPTSPVGGSQPQKGKKSSSNPAKQAGQPARNAQKKTPPQTTGQNAGQNPPQSQRVCKFFQSGDCKNGDNCNFAHTQAPQQAAAAQSQSTKPSKSNNRSTNNPQPSTNAAKASKQKSPPTAPSRTGNGSTPSAPQVGKSNPQRSAKTKVNASTTATPAQKQQQSAQTIKSKNPSPKTNRPNSAKAFNPPMPGSFPASESAQQSAAAASNSSATAAPGKSKPNVKTNAKAPPPPAGSLLTPPLSPDEEL